MLGLIKKQLLKQKQNIIQKKYPSVNIALHQDLPGPSINKMVELAKIVAAVNAWEPKISSLSDLDLKKKTEEFREHVLEKAKELEPQFQELEEALLAVAIPEEKDRIKEKLKIIRNRIFQEILPEVFATVREAARRTVNMRHFDAQIAGA